GVPGDVVHGPVLPHRAAVSERRIDERQGEGLGAGRYAGPIELGDDTGAQIAAVAGVLAVELGAVRLIRAGDHEAGPRAARAAAAGAAAAPAAAATGAAARRAARAAVRAAATRPA